MIKTKIHYTFTLSHHVGFPPPTVSVAVDVNNSKKAEPGEYIRLRQKELTWSGSITFIRPGGTKGLLVMSNMLGALGARYTIVVRKGSAKGAVLQKSEGFIEMVPQMRFMVLS